MLKREREREGCESNKKQPHLFIPSKTTTLFPEFAVEYLPLVELQSRFLRLQWRTCPWAEHSDDGDMKSWNIGPFQPKSSYIERYAITRYFCVSVNPIPPELNNNIKFFPRIRTVKFSIWEHWKGPKIGSKIIC